MSTIKEMAEAYAVSVCPAPLHAVHASILEVIDAQRCDAKAAYLAEAGRQTEMRQHYAQAYSCAMEKAQILGKDI